MHFITQLLFRMFLPFKNIFTICCKQCAFECRMLVDQYNTSMLTAILKEMEVEGKYKILDEIPRKRWKLQLNDIA